MKPIHRYLVTALRIIPVICAMVFAGHVALLLAGINEPYSEFVVDSALINLVTWLLLSFAFEFCNLHRAIIIYNYTISLCIDYQRTVGFGDWLLPARLIAMSVGLLLIILYIHRRYAHKDQKNACQFVRAFADMIETDTCHLSEEQVETLMQTMISSHHNDERLCASDRETLLNLERTSIELNIKLDQMASRLDELEHPDGGRIIPINQSDLIND